MEYEVGKYYWIRCAEMINSSNEVVTYVPVIGEVHKDAQIGVDYKHFHIDGRFDNSYAKIDKDGKTNVILGAHPHLTADLVVSKIVLKIRKCKRESTGVKPPQGAKKYWDWYRSMIGKSCAGKRCPHLGTEMLERDGRLVCPLHSLVGDIKTELIIAQ